MKKLLVILFLLFPFHGAWGKSKILTCRTESGLGDFKLDLEKKNFHPVPLTPDDAKNIILLEDEDAYVFSYDYAHDPVKDSFFRSMIKIDRYSGKFEKWYIDYSLSTGKEIDNLKDIWKSKGECDLNVKKKF